MKRAESLCLSCGGVICNHGSAEPSEQKIERDSARFMATGTVSAWSDREMFISTIAGRYPRCGAVCPGTSRVPAHDWGQVLMCEGKSCSHVGSFTSSTCTRGNLAQCSTESTPIIDFWAQCSIKK